MRCIICQKDTKPWCLVENKNYIVDDEGKNIGDTFQACSYSCCLKLREKIGPYKIMNREDFCWLRPIVPKNKKFAYLTANEISELSELEKDKYYNQRDNHIEIDTVRANIQLELEMEDYNTTMIENENSSSGEEYYDDY